MGGERSASVLLSGLLLILVGGCLNDPIYPHPHGKSDDPKVLPAVDCSDPTPADQRCIQPLKSDRRNPTPTPAHPLVGCIAPTPSESARAEGRIPPEIVKVIGITPLEDGKRWKVLRGPNFDERRWEPHTDIVFGARCGPELDAFISIWDASRGDIDAGDRSRQSFQPPRPRR